MEPLDRGQVGYDQKTRYHYWPAGAEEFAALSGLELPDAKQTSSRNMAWERSAQEWVNQDPDKVDWSRALACLQVWQARVGQGLGHDIWRADRILSDAQEAQAAA